jgi:hypothetical protein
MELTQVAEQLCGKCGTVLTSAHTRMQGRVGEHVRSSHAAVLHQHASPSEPTQQLWRHHVPGTAVLVLEAATVVHGVFTYLASMCVLLLLYVAGVLCYPGEACG